MIQLFDRIVLNRDLPDRSLKQGDVGTVVMIYKNGKGTRWNSLLLMVLPMLLKPSRFRTFGRLRKTKLPMSGN
jgi:hypothetical protein